MKPQWSKWARTTHWISSALGLLSLLSFSVTGITLNHPDWFSANRSVEQRTLVLTESQHVHWRQQGERAQFELLAQLLDQQFALPLPQRFEQDDVEWVFDYPKPGGVITVVFDVETGELFYEEVNDGWVSLINDLHKGRHSGRVWSGYIDITALVCMFFSLTGLWLLWVHARKRLSTWPLVLAGGLVPLFIYGIFVL
ncbi:PepSY-associated TM helix domain-containing protein [Simiduia agarivorans]|uniref:PepSY-associated TM helix family protein n=1 Tax=Simiduia agarivorans (strain DSM 21679 / JCM 13881 / BCRC 17597 / SA1) TaxID=1117647 RepID=K4KLJ6_SIMAS|nr:PepSY-associated TM helix domain-containing protein [Simiduia agarivorans]AFV00045.1 PepSY-associated TM helix family protein [Simiduia agarivorans SA1 = DSM 21679]